MDGVYENKKRCGFCGEEIESGWRRCPFCGSLLDISVDELKLDTTAFSLGQVEDNEEINVDAEQMHPETKPENPTEYTVETGNAAAPQSVKADNPIFEKTAASIIWDNKTEKEKVRPLSNGIKVLLTVISAVIPGIGQLIGLIASIIFMSSEEDPDRRSFGVALLIASLITFVLSCVFYSILIMAFADSLPG